MKMEHLLKVDVCHLHYALNTILQVNVKLARIKILMVIHSLVIGMIQPKNVEMQVVHKLMILSTHTKLVLHMEILLVLNVQLIRTIRDVFLFQILARK